MENDRRSGTRRTYGTEGTGAPRTVGAQRSDAPRVKRKKKRKYRMSAFSADSRFRKGLIIAAAAAAAIILLLMSPVFDIQEIHVEGNKVVTLQTISGKIGDFVGTNLFRVNAGAMEDRLLEIPQISDVSVSKKYFPPSLTVTVEEAVPVAYIMSGSRRIVINSDLKVVDDSGLFDTEALPNISGVSVPEYKLNTRIKTDSEEREAVLSELLSALEKTGVLYKTTYINIDDLADIRLNYDNRLEIICGSTVELERKIRMFAETLNSSALSANAQGKMDLSVTGQAVYTP